jgi:uncharacterized protein
MIVEEHSMANAFVHVELNTTDTAKAKAFYGKLFDWKMEDMDMGPAGKYTMINPGEGTGGGLWKSQMPGGSFWLAYAIVDDVKTATAKAKSLGASVMKDATEVPGMGWYSIITDPTGAHLGLWQATGK